MPALSNTPADKAAAASGPPAARRCTVSDGRGDRYLRMLLIHGARPVLLHAKKRRDGERDRLRVWALDRERARSHNKAAVALANKLARIIWAVWRREHACADLALKDTE